MFIIPTCGIPLLLRHLLLDNSENAKPLEVSLGTYLRDCLGKSLDQEDVDIYS